jgi:hypothetical protein
MSPEDLTVLANFLTNVLSYSSETTAVNSERNSSNVSSEEAAPYSAGLSAGDLVEIVTAARPGVHITINVYTGVAHSRRIGSAGTSARFVGDSSVESAQADISSSCPAIPLIYAVVDERPKDDPTETEFMVQSTWLHTYFCFWPRRLISETRV